VRRYLTAEGLIDEDSEQRQVAELRADFDAAVAEVEAGAQPGVDAVFDHVYARPPARLEQQRREAR
jgi:2-oxoisovalerate dehydrogenase E1 component alpha subunit